MYSFQCSIAQFVKQCLLKFRDNFPRVYFYSTFRAQTFRLLSRETVSYSCPCIGWLVVLLFYVHGKHLRSCRDSQLT